MGLENKRMYSLSFIKLVRAFEKVPRDRLWNILRERGASGTIGRLIQKIY